MAEIKTIVEEAYKTGTMQTTDWEHVEVKSLKPYVMPTLGSKRKLDLGPGSSSSTYAGRPSKAAKKDKSSLSWDNTNNMSNGGETSRDDEASRGGEASRLRREDRFAREHEIARQRQAGERPEPAHSRHVNAPWSNGSSLLDRMETVASAPNAKKRARWAYQDSSENAYDPNVLNWDRHTIVGRCKDIEKPYLRLTTEADPANVRPLHVLEQALQVVTTKYKTQAAKYDYICDQMKSIRQDLTVQRITTGFTVKVYEIHARIALESKDLVEYNQCQSALKTLHAMGLEGHYEEFLAYRILYFLYTRSRSDLNVLITQLTPSQKATPCIRHALEVQKAMATNNYHAFFALYLNAPNMGPYMMDFYADRERCSALIIMCTSYKSLPIPFIMTELGFSNVSEAVKYLQDHEAAYFQGMEPPTAAQPTGSWKAIRKVVPDQDKVLDCALARPHLTNAAPKYNKLDIKRI